MDTERDVGAYLNKGILTHLGLWLDQLDLPETEQGHLNYLAFQAFKIVCPTRLQARRAWSIKNLTFRLRQETVHGRIWPWEYLAQASTLVLSEAVYRGFLERKNGQDIELPIAKNTMLRFRPERTVYGKAYDYLAFLGELAKVDPRQIGAYRRTARDLMG